MIAAHTDDPFDGFTDEQIDTGEVTLRVRRRGAGPPLIALHGYPQTHLAWAAVAPALARRFDLILPDLRGYGGSDAPARGAVGIVAALPVHRGRLSRPHRRCHGGAGGAGPGT
jgi:pimeloyl-ACP methyl ester carboxylesterase